MSNLTWNGKKFAPPNSIDSEAIIDGTIVAADLAPGTITAALLADDYVNTSGDTMTGQLGVTRSLSTQVAVSTKVTGDTNNRFELRPEGFFGGSGSTAVDTKLSRTGVGEWTVPFGQFLKVPSVPTDDAHAANKKYVDDEIAAIPPATSSHSFTAVLTTNTTLTGSEDIVLVDTSGGAVTITLPLSAPSDGAEFNIKKAVSGNNLVVSGNGRNIDSAASQTFSGPDDSVTIVYNLALDKYFII